MYEMRPAAEGDTLAVRDLLSAHNRCASRNGLAPADSIAVRLLIDDPDDDMVLMLLTEDSAVVGCVVLHAALPFGWTPSERAEPSLGLSALHTHPDQQGNGLTRRITLWALDFAARRPGTRLHWVRATVPGTPLAAYFRDQLGWEEVRVTHDGAGRRCSQMQHAPHRQRGLSALIRGVDPILGTSTPLPAAAVQMPVQARTEDERLLDEHRGSRT
ncbi:GNAT family N-acetyltransferase [Streptomyces sp. NPDC057280]|uniref:GNAT family N-acetyltransferase n=1 Tax=Streptomyces sp. NPDC057280 TaxID=3346081 RepID=UPI00362FC862